MKEYQVTIKDGNVAIMFIKAFESSMEATAYAAEEAHNMGLKLPSIKVSPYVSLLKRAA